VVDAAALEHAVEEQIARPLGLSVEHAAAGILDVREAELLGQVTRADDAADRAGDQRPGQLARLHRDRAAVGRHDSQIERRAGALGHAAHALELLA